MKKKKRLRRRIMHLETALRPFAEAAPYFAQRYTNDDAVVEFTRKGEHVRIRVGDLRVAEAILREIERNDGG